MMELHTEETIIVTLAHLLSGKRAPREMTSSALTVLCDGFSFDCGLLYLADDSHQMCLQECCGKKKTAMQQAFYLNALSPTLYANLLQEPVIYCLGQEPFTAQQSQILSLLGAQAAVAVSVADESGHICGLIALCNLTARSALDAETWKILETALSILSRHIAVLTYQSRLGLAQAAFERILDNTGIDIYVNDFNNHDILYVNRSMAAPYGGQEQFFGRKCWQVLYPGQTGPCEFCPQKKLIDDAGNPTKLYTWDYQRVSDGAWFRVFSVAFLWAGGRLAHVVSSADITDNKRNEALIEYLANYDQLTNLPNRRRLVSACEERIHISTSKLTYLLFFDIDGFKAINDSLGHDAGDEFLVQLGAFFSSIPLLKNSIYRTGGDEFVALLEDDATNEDVRNLAQFIHTRFQSPWVLKNGSVKCNTSIGVAQYPQDGLTAETLLFKADQAMYHAKKSGGGQICFHSDV